jgi:cholinesterase
MVFGASADVSGLPNSSDETKMIALVQKAWAAFAEDPTNGLTEVMGWPKYDPASELLSIEFLEKAN